MKPKLIIEVTEEEIKIDGEATVNDLMNVIKLCAEAFPKSIRAEAVLEVTKNILGDLTREEQ